MRREILGATRERMVRELCEGLLLLVTFRPADLILAENPLKALRQDLLVHRLSHELELEQLLREFANSRNGSRL